MSLLSVRLENFRGFSDASIDTKPLTVLVGANSSGKSSFSHALSAMAHAQRLYSNSPTLTLTPVSNLEDWPADLGDLADLRKAGSDGSVCISIRTDEGTIRWGFGLSIKDERERSLEISLVEQPVGVGMGSHEGTIALPSQFSPIAVSGANFTGMNTPDRNMQTQSFRKVSLRQWQEAPDETESFVDLRGLTVNSVTHERGTHVQLNNLITREVKSIFEGLTYLRAIRVRPSRNYQRRVSNAQLPIGYGGEGFADVLHDRAGEIIKFVEPPIEEQMSKGPHQFLRSKWTASSDTLLEAVNSWLRHMGLATEVEARQNPAQPSLLQIRIKIGSGSPHDISEVGFGLSQILPIVISGLLQSSNAPFIVDLPEAHLHPRPQAAVADFFCGMALGGKRCIVETHSEMFVNQLRLRAEMDPELSEMIAIYFLDEPSDGHCNQPRPIGLGEKDQIRWPQGFLEEAWDIESKISNIRIARRAQA
ncbi:AAA family ATPase [Granulicella paludicola]|uniref:AAA family ATPase n=1 Tax=Granulicella paludicola TaxID=474951 RepID=UPI0021E051E3|nr:AAA family ATPase [Granulicella paludicola]